MLPRQLYVTGTDTDVGKTVTSAALCAAWGLDYHKPVQSGLDGPTDTEVVQRLAPGVRTWPEAARLTTPASPHTAARDDGTRLDLSSFTLPTDRPLLVEGAGGWMVPYVDDPVQWQADLVRHLGLPVLVVARSTLGTLNHTFLTLRALEADGVDCLGLILVGPPHPDNEADLARLGGVPVLARLPRVADPARDLDALVQRLEAARDRL